MESRIIVLSGSLVPTAGCSTARQTAPPAATTPATSTTAATTKSAADLVDGIVLATQGKKTYRVRLMPLDHKVTNAAEGTVPIRQSNGASKRRGISIPLSARRPKATPPDIESPSTCSAPLTDPYLKEEREIGLQQGGRTLDYELLTDAQNSLLSAKSFVKAVSTGKPVTTEIQFDRWGEPAGITEPPAAETIAR